MYVVDSVVIQFLAFIKSKDLLPTNTKILLVGETSKLLHEESLAARMKQMGYRAKKILLKAEGVPQDISQFDLVISVQGCTDEEAIFNACGLYDKKYIILPCINKEENIHQKVITYIHRYKVPGIYVAPERGKHKNTEFTYPNFRYLLHNL